MSIFFNDTPISQMMSNSDSSLAIILLLVWLIMLKDPLMIFRKDTSNSLSRLMNVAIVPLTLVFIFISLDRLLHILA